MAYTVVSLFPVAVDPENVSEKLKNIGFSDDNIHIAKYSIDGDLVDESQDQEEKAKNF